MFRTKTAVSALAKNITKGAAALQQRTASNSKGNKKGKRQKITADTSDALGVEFDASKAGLQQVDKHYVESVIAEASRGSRFTKYKLQKQKEREARNEVVLQKAEHFHKKLSKEERRAITAETDRIQAELEATRVFSTPVVEEQGLGGGAPARKTTKKHVFMHFDMDMFYAAVEEKKDPTLKEVPFAVGSKSMLSTSNYIARQYGVRSGMPGFIARKLCPELVIVPVDMEGYKAEAEVIRRTIAKYDPFFVTVGLDEMTINVTDYLYNENQKRRLAAAARSKQQKLQHARLTPEALCAQIRAEVFETTGLTCSGGIGPTPALCKLASNVKKPNGQYYYDFTTREEVLQYMTQLPIRDVSGIGFAQEKKLKALGIEHGSDMLTQKDLLYYLFGGDSKTFRFYLSIGLGLMQTHVDRALAKLQQHAQQQAVRQQVLQEKRNDRRSSLSSSSAAAAAAGGAVPVQLVKQSPFAIGGGAPRKSVGKEITLGERMKEERFRDKLRNVLLHVVTGAQETLLREHLMTKQVHLVIKDIYFHKHTFSYTFPEKTNEVKRILDGCHQIILRETLAALKAARASEKEEKLARKKNNNKKKKKVATTGNKAKKGSSHAKTYYANIFDLSRIRLVGVHLTQLTSVYNEADAVQRAATFMKKGKSSFVFAGGKSARSKASAATLRKKKKDKKSNEKKKSGHHVVAVVKKASKEVKRQKRKTATLTI